MINLIDCYKATVENLSYLDTLICILNHSAGNSTIVVHQFCHLLKLKLLLSLIRDPKIPNFHVVNFAIPIFQIIASLTVLKHFHVAVQSSFLSIMSSRANSFKKQTTLNE